MSPEQIAIEALKLALAASSAITGLITDAEKRTLEERIARAEAAIKDPINVSADDAVRKAALERAIRGEG